MSLITPAEYRLADPEASLGDVALQQRIDAIEAEIVRDYGAHATASEVHIGGGLYLFPARRVASVTSLTEEAYGVSTVLAADDYEVLNAGLLILRKSLEATNPRRYWANVARLIYVPYDDAAIRIGVLIDLMKSDLRWTGLVSWRKGSWAESQGGPQGGSRESERRAILARLSPGVMIY